MNKLLLFVIILKIIFALVVIICEKKPKPIIFWLFIILIFDFVGFIAYIILGNRLKFRTKHLLQEKQKSTKNYLKYCAWYKNYSKNNDLYFNQKQLNLIKILKNKYNSNIWHNNKVKIFNSPQQFLLDLLRDLKNAKNFINIEFYIFADDETGSLISQILIQKAKKGVAVKIVYDAIGSRKTKGQFWNELKNAGVQVIPFFSAPLNINLMNLKVNYRNHRKLVCIDGDISYIGGLNLRNDHMNKDKKLSPWRDTHIRLKGNASYAVNNIFLNDWCFANKSKLDKKVGFYFPKPKVRGSEKIQILESGPEKKDNQIKKTYEHIIQNAADFLYVQTPYFVVNANIINLLKDAVRRGVDVRLMIPKIPDKKIVYMCTLWCVKKLLKYGIRVYLYNGFIHSKTLNSEFVLSIGSCNFDNRSFELNFEATSLIYNDILIKNYKNKFLFDLKKCQLLDYKRAYKSKPKMFFAFLIYKLFGKLL